MNLVIRDNGKGFDTKAISTGNGLQNMLQRAKNSGAELTISSQSGKGTSVELVMPLPG
ncbi:MAG: hypothetical protein NTW29_19120 [Bacteroidetes bacterium]|nr:hypothetical protein [Bacteroidota bacterium]